MRTKNPAKVIRVRAENFRKAAADALGVTLDKDIADRLGHDLSAFSRLMTGTTQPSGEFIAKALDRLPDHPFEELFEVGEYDPHRRHRRNLSVRMAKAA